MRNESGTLSITGKFVHVVHPQYIFLILSYRISLAPPFPGLRRFKDGRNFSQWTGNDSKALMKVIS